MKSSFLLLNLTMNLAWSQACSLIPSLLFECLSHWGSSPGDSAPLAFPQRKCWRPQWSTDHISGSKSEVHVENRGQGRVTQGRTRFPFPCSFLYAQKLLFRFHLGNSWPLPAYLLVCVCHSPKKTLEAVKHTYKLAQSCSTGLY